MRKDTSVLDVYIKVLTSHSHTLCVPTKPLLLSPSPALLVTRPTQKQQEKDQGHQRPRPSLQSKIHIVSHVVGNSHETPVVPPFQHTICRRCWQTTLHFCMDTSLSLKVLYVTHDSVVVSSPLPSLPSRNVMIGCMSIPMAELIGPDKVSKTTSPVTVTWSLPSILLCPSN